MLCIIVLKAYLYLDPKVRLRRKKYGGNKKKRYTEGWVEFLDKRVAKTIANTLNAKPIGIFLVIS